MDLTSPLPYLLFLHVFGAILAFGPTYAYSIMGRMAGREPQHANFSTRQVAAISRAQVYPLAIVQGVTGVLLIAASGIKPEKQPWLVAGDHPLPHHPDLRADRAAQLASPGSSS